MYNEANSSVLNSSKLTRMLNISAIRICFDRFVGIQDGEDATRATVKIIESFNR